VCRVQRALQHHPHATGNELRPSRTAGAATDQRFEAKEMLG
jgi:hypothetical protein